MSSPGSAEVRGGICREFYARASRGNLDLLPRGSSRRTGLLRRALACLGVRSSRLHPEQLSSLGALVCDMEPETITASDPGILENLKLCPALTGAQQDALNAVLLGGGTVYGTSEQLDLCLSNEVLKANLKPLLDQPLTKEYLKVMKKKLEQIYPSGIPEDQLKLLGLLSRLYTAEEISQWQVTSSDTLSALLNPSDGKWNASQVQQLLSRYQALGGTLTGPLLQELGGRNLCNLQEEQIEHIPPEAIRTAGQLDISSCSQTKKDQLYRKAQEAFAGQAGTTRAYYCQIWPYLESVVSSTAKTTTLACKTSAPPALLDSSSTTTTSSETTKNPPAGVPESPRPTPGGYINLQPEAGKA
ncbi:mesothelin-like protein [Limosa lapponica baueri]|uniref:Mesothelin-like protein n=1 Tax=Limosa lapponica baueri TaxID=1758121 RepID=A0A2I0TTC7_LIMLA|nr:mesothelin-like protein [Limosa lapponica baueri]